MSAKDKLRVHRQRLREQGLRPVQLWLPDVRSDAFVDEAHRSSLAVALSRSEEDDQAFIDSVSVLASE